MSRCSQCDHTLEVTELRCPACAVTLSGTFASPRLARLAGDQQRLIEQVILAGGNLKEVARDSQISYPTFRKRLDAVIEALTKMRHDDDQRAQHLLGDVEAGRIAPEAAARQIREMNGGS
ncbi:MAG: DUF2089 domain-containing protein [Aestuariivirgaceae bacterium]